jgi:simple sugar transport system substrate-binding protein
MIHTAGTRARQSAAVLAVLALTLAACSETDGDDETESESAPVASGGQFCQDMDIVFFPGGTSGGPFETVVYNGAKAAEETFGPNVQYQWSDWDPNKMITQFNDAVATSPDGIAVMGHPGDAAFDPLIDQARQDGILVTVMNTELPKAQAKYSAEGTGYVGAVLYQAGADLANEAIARAGLQEGDRVFVWGLASQPGRGERTNGITETLEDAGMTVDYLEINDATNADPAQGVSTFTGYVSKNSDVKAAFFDHGNLTATIPTYMRAAGLDPGSVYTAGFDMSPATVQGIEDGFVSLVIDQQQWLQGYLSVLQLCLTHEYGMSGLHIDTGGGFVDESNIGEIAPLVEEQIR